jgi:hypothetical protein
MFGATLQSLGFAALESNGTFTVARASTGRETRLSTGADKNQLRNLLKILFRDFMLSFLLV